jgi:tetratricopeptide (TPR) repeat protein
MVVHLFARISFFILIFHLIFSDLFAQENAKKLDAFYLQYRTGNYQSALQELELVDGGEDFEATRHYLKALTYKNMQKHVEAIAHFKKAIRLGKKGQELFFEYGQSLFAVNDLEKAKRAFRISFEGGFKRDISLYYMAHIGEILEDHQAVKTNYLKLLKDDKADKDMRQVAYLRLAELIYERSKNKFYAQNYIAKYIVPLLDKGLEIDSDTQTAKDIESRYDEILLKHNMHPLLLENGRMLSRHANTITYTQQVQQDDNVTLLSDAPAAAVETTDIASTIVNSEFYFARRLVGGRYFVFTPEIRLNHSEYLNDTNPEVYQNNSYGISPAFRGSYNFSWNRKRAELLFELEHNYTARDKNQEGSRTFFGRSTTFTLGVRNKFFGNGDTTIKLRQRSLSSFSDAISGTTTTLYADQLYVRENGHIIVGLFIMDLYRPEDENNATDSYLFRMDYLMPRLIWGIDFNWSASLTMLDTKLQEDRGLERNISLGLKVQKRFTTHWRFGLTFNRTQNDSGDPANFSYTKTVTGVELRYSFF